MGYVQGNWTPTKRRGPIAAEFTGPGPACIGPPSLAATKSKAPAFTLHGRPPVKTETVGPGPATYDLTMMTHKKGRVSPSGTALSGRPKEYSGFVTPSPADYAPEKCDDTLHDSSPKFSFGIKNKDQKPDDIPGPNKYNIPGLLGGSVHEGNKRQSPAFSLTGRVKPASPPQTPGPGTYKTSDPNVQKQKSPAFTLSHRYDVPSDKTKVPGPGAFSPEKVRLDNTPKFSFGIRHSQYSASMPDKNK